MNRTQKNNAIYTVGRKVMVWALLGVALLLIGLYFSLTVGVALYANENRQIDNEIPKLSTSTSELEFRYISLMNELSEETAVENGLVIISSVEFISSSSLGYRRFSSFE